MAWAVKQKTGDALGRAILLTLANYANDAGECWPSLSRLADDCEMDRSSVIRKLAGLIAKGLVSKEQKATPAGTYNVYTLSLSATPSGTQPLPPVAHSDHPSRTQPLGVVAHSHPILSREPIKEPIKEEMRVSRETPSSELLKVLSEETARALIEHRSKLKAPLTASAAKRLAGKLSKCTDPEAGASLMLERGWKGFEPEWMTATSSTGQPSRAQAFWGDTFKKVVG